MNLKKNLIITLIFLAEMFFMTFLAWHIADCLAESSLRYCPICEYAACDDHATEGMILKADSQIKLIRLNGKGGEEIFAWQDLDRLTEMAIDDLSNQTIRFVCQEGNETDKGFLTPFKRCAFWLPKQLGFQGRH